MVFKQSNLWFFLFKQLGEIIVIIRKLWINMKKNEKYYRISTGSHSRIPYVLFGIVAFLLVGFPFFAVNMRFQLGAIFLKIFDTIGTYSMIIGGALVTISVLSLLTRSPIKMRTFMTGIALLWVGSWCTGTAIDIFGIPVGQQQPPPGYH